MDKNMRKLALGFLAFLCVLSLPLVSSCKKGAQENSGDKTAPVAPENESDAEAADGKILPELPETDFGGYEFKYFVWDVTEWGGNDTQKHRDLYSESENGEPINDMVYRRNARIEDEYNVVFRQDFVLISKFNSQLAKEINSGSSDTDVVFYQMASMGNLVGNGLLRNIYDLQYADFTKPWWDANSINDLSIGKKLFGISSAITVMDKMGAQALLFNKNLLQEYQVEDPYKMVRDGIWTIDKFGEMVKTVSKDLDGNGIMDENDLWGLLAIRDSMGSFSNGCGTFIAGKDASDGVTLTFAGERQYGAYEKILDILLDKNVTYNSLFLSPNNWMELNIEMFDGNRAFCFWTRLRDCELLRGMDTPFGILPVPKNDEQQSRYYTSINPYTSTLLGVPASNAEMERTGMLLEALSAESLYTVQPAYYETTLQGKVARDDESEEMLNIIYKNVCYDIGEILGLGGLEQYVYLVDQNNRNVTSFLDARKEKAQNDIDSLMQKISELYG
ncbi:MAG: hypothetical protein FWG34_13300 [Oscillospiraceae bacterium]|nr:hypothetical protein [Oscillospiraceae bacterium]